MTDEPAAVVPTNPKERRPILAPAAKATGRGVVAVAKSKPVVVPAKATATGTRKTTRAAWTMAAGASHYLKRLQRKLTNADLVDGIQMARAAGDVKLMADVQGKLTDARKNRREELLKLPMQVLMATGAVLILVLVALMIVFIGGVIVWLSSETVCNADGCYTDEGITWTGWWDGFVTALDVIGAIIYYGFWAAVILAVPTLLWLLYQEGKKAAKPPRWLSTATEKAELDSYIDERMISLALGNCGVPVLAKFHKDGGLFTYTVPPRVDGDGTYAQVRLPIGATAEQVADPKPRSKVAGALTRAVLETWLYTGDEASVLDLWIANKGTLAKGAGEWPLFHDGVCDVFEGVPFGKSQRGDVVMAPLFENNWLMGGRPGQGKSSALRTLLLGAALDPLAELWVFVHSQTPDFAPFEPRLSRYAMGMDDEVAEQAVQALRDLIREMERRGKVLGKENVTKTSRKLAKRRGLGMHPLIAAFDEVHELFMHPQYGKEAAELMIRLIRMGRKFGIIVLAATQSPTRESIPRDVTRNMSCGVAFSVSDHVANDGLLGTGKYKAGIRATDLRAGVDRGTCVTVGLTEAAFELIRTYFIRFDEDKDEVTPIITRAMQAVQELPNTGAVVAKAEVIDNLVDIERVLGGQARMQTRTVLQKLAEFDPTTYTGWTSADLKTALNGHGIDIGKSNGQSVVRLAEVQAAIAERPAAGEVDGEDDA